MPFLAPRERAKVATAFDGVAAAAAVRTSISYVLARSIVGQARVG